MKEIVVALLANWTWPFFWALVGYFVLFKERETFVHLLGRITSIKMGSFALDVRNAAQETGTLSFYEKLDDSISWRHRFTIIWQDLFLRSPYTPDVVLFAYFDSIRHAQPILVALRRDYNTMGKWPELLNDLASELQSESLIDPQSQTTHIYQRTEKGFRLYSVGPNGRNENGKNDRTADGPDDIIIWPK